MSGTRPFQILIVDDHPIVREGLAQLINRQEDLEVCGEAEDACLALQQIGDLHPDLVTVDISIPGRGGLELIKDIRARYPRIVVLVVSMHDELLYAERALRAGASGYINKEEAKSSMIKAIWRVLGGERYLSESASSKILSHFVDGAPGTSMESLSDRELQVFRMIGQGLATRQIAADLCLSIKTVEGYRARLKRKLSLSSSSDLIRSAVKWAEEPLSP